MTATIIDMFTRKPIPDGPLPTTYAAGEQIKVEFAGMAARGTRNLDPEDEEWFVSTFKDLYLSEFMDCARGIDEAQSVQDLDHFMRRAQLQVHQWPDFTTPE